MGRTRSAIMFAAVVLAIMLAWGVTPTAIADSVDVQSEPTSPPVLVAQGSAAVLTSDEAFEPLKGSGTQDDPYQLSSSDDYATLHAAVNDNGIDCGGLFFKQTCDVELPIIESGVWTSIGTGSSRFKGTLDGDGYTLEVPEGSGPLFGYVQGQTSNGETPQYATIRNLCISGSRIEGCGLIDNLTGSGDGTAVFVDNVRIKSGTRILKSGILSVLKNSTYAGTSAGYVSIIKNCVVEQDVEIGYDGTQSQIGSIAGRFNGVIEGCTSFATVKGRDYVGGIVGSRDNAMGTYEIHGCTFSGEIQAQGEYVGGIAGGNYDNSTAPNGKKPTIENCSVSGSVAGADKVGGILGGDRFGIQAWDDARIANNSVAGQLEAENGFTVGGIVGYYANLNKHDIFLNNCFKDGCGANSAFGEVVSVDTSNASYAGTAEVPYGNDAASGAYYYCSDGATTDYLSTADADIKSLLDIPQSGYKAITHQNENRTDDPLGADAAVLAYSNDTGELETTCVSLSLSGSYKTDYEIGEVFSTDGMVITGTWTDGASQQVSPSDCEITGFDGSKPGYQTVTIAYGNCAVKFHVLVTNGASSAFNSGISGTVYLSVSDDARYKVSDGVVSDTVMWHVPISLADVAAWANSDDYNALNLQKYANFASAGASYRYELTVMQLFTYANERYSSVGAAGLEFSGAVGSSYMKNGFFGHDDNLNYYVNGSCPTDASGSVGVTSERITLKDGMYIDVAMFADRAFHEDLLAGFHYFLSSSGVPVHGATASVGSAFTFKLTRIYEFTDGYKPEMGYSVFWGTESDWHTWASTGNVPTGNLSGMTKTKADGTAAITFAQTGTYFVWVAGNKGEAGGEHANSIVSTPSAIKVAVAKGANPLTASAQAKSKIPIVSYGTAKTMAASSAFTVSKAQGAVSYKKVSGNAKIAVATNGMITVKKGIEAGTYPLKVAITAAGNDSYKAGTITVTAQIRVLKANKAAPKRKSVSKTFTVKSLKKKAAKVTLPKVTTNYGKAKWAVAKKDAKKVLTLKGSKVVVKKGAKKGTYVLKLKASVAESAKYKAATSKVVTVKVKVK